MTYWAIHGSQLAICLTPAVLFARLLIRHLFPERDPLIRAAAGLLMVFALVAASGGILGVVGLFSFWGFVFALWLSLATLLFIRRLTTVISNSTDFVSLPAAPPAVLFLAAVSLTLLIGALAAKLAQPTVEYDELTYHLHFPAQWLAAGRIFIIDTPFGDAAPAYAPIWGEIWNGWLMAPMVGDIPNPLIFKLTGIDAVAKVGQFPFFILLVVSLTMLARRLTEPNWRIYLPAILLAFVPWVLYQAASAGVDLMMAACLVASLAFALEYHRQGNPAAAGFSGLALGLAAGVKFLTLIYAPLLLVPIIYFLLARRQIKPILLWLIALAAFGLPWYVRNCVTTGNPLFPAQFLFFDGAYTRQAMMDSAFHVPDFTSALAVAAHAVGFWMIPLALVGMAWALFLSSKQSAWRWLAWLAPVGLVWHFLLVPYSSQDRFLLWVVALSLLPLAAWPGGRKGNIALLLLLMPCLLFDLLGPQKGFQLGALPVSARGLVDTNGWLYAALTLGLVMAVGKLAKERMRHPGWRIAMVFTVALAMALIFAQPRDHLYVRTNLMSIAELPFAGYVKLWRQQAKVVAYTGRNRPYYLTGRGGGTQVKYINVDGKSDWLLHDYVPVLSQANALDITREKFPWRRMSKNYERWRDAMLLEKVDYLFVEPYYYMDRDIYDDADSPYPIEREWARENKDIFTLIDSATDYELYAVDRSGP